MFRHAALISIASLAVLGALAACRSHDEPATSTSNAAPANRGAGDDGATTVSGSLTGDVPDGLRVAAVWRAADNTLHVQGDAAVANGKFTLSLAPLPSDFWVPTGTDNPAIGQYPDEASPPATIDPAELTSGLAQFVVYRDTNGNGALDLDPITSVTPDQFVASSPDLYLRYYAGGTDADYQKLSGVGGPTAHAGYNLLLRHETELHWVGLDQVTIALPTVVAQLLDVCPNVGREYGIKTLPTADAGRDPYLQDYPNADDARLTCLANGYAFTFPNWVGADCAPGFKGLCADDTGLAFCLTSPIDPDAGTVDGGVSFPPGSLLPRNWPCVVDGGVYADAGPALQSPRY